MSLADDLGPLTKSEAERAGVMEAAVRELFDTVNRFEPAIGLFAVVATLDQMLRQIDKQEPPPRTKKAYKPLQAEVRVFLECGLQALIEAANKNERAN